MLIPVRNAGTEESTLDDLLLSFREAGQMDSQGSFTMAGRKAAGRLAHSLLPNPADWILKVVQGACRGGAPALRISQTSRATHIEFELSSVLDIRAFELSLTQGSVAAQEGIDELATALRVVGLGQQRSWVARLRGAEVTHWVLVKDGEVSLESTKENSGQTGITEILLGIAFPAGQAGKLGGLVRFGAAIQQEHEALTHRARACPIPLLLDGQRLDTLERDPSLESFQHEAFLGVALGQNPTFPPIALPRGLQQSQPRGFSNRFTDPRPFFLPQPLPEAGSSVMRVAFRYQYERHAREGGFYKFRLLPTPSRVMLVRHGVVVGKRNLGMTEAVAVDVYLNSDGARSDLSGLVVDVRPEDVEAARNEIRGLDSFLRNLETCLEAHVCLPRPRDLVCYSGLSGAALALAPWPVKILTLGVSAFQLRAAALQYQRIVRDCREEVVRFRRAQCDPEEQRGQVGAGAL